MTSSFFVSSPIFYVNDAPHIGHCYTSIACDCLARFYRLKNHEVFFLTGTDEHGQKVEKSALSREKQPQEFCDEVSQKFRELGNLLNLSNNDFIRTTEERHKKSAQKLWKLLENKGWIYKGVYEGWYAVRDEAFYGEDEIINGKAPTGAEVAWHKEESYFFRLSAFQEKLLTLYEAAPDFIRPASKHNEIVSFVKSGLRDLSISRNSFSWGIRVPGNEESVMYVWLDALTNYLSALGFADFEGERPSKENLAKNEGNLFQKFWLDSNRSPLHIIGKDILRFHAVYWPAFLMAAEINLPYGIYAHGWWTNEGQKISKSLGNVIDPKTELDWIAAAEINKKTALDYFRFFLLREVPFGNDGDYSRSHLATRINAELANNIGNLAQRSLSMIYKNCAGKIPPRKAQENFDSLNHEPVLTWCEEYLENYFVAFEQLAFDKAIGAIIDLATALNRYFNDLAPWKLQKDGKIAEFNLCLHDTAEGLRILGLLLLPFLPHSANQLLEILNIPISKRNFGAIADSIESQHQINIPIPLFPRLEAKS